MKELEECTTIELKELLKRLKSNAVIYKNGDLRLEDIKKMGYFQLMQVEKRYSGIHERLIKAACRAKMSILRPKN